MFRYRDGKFTGKYIIRYKLTLRMRYVGINRRCFNGINHSIKNSAFTIKLLLKIKKQMLEQEIIQSIMILKNLSIVNRENPLSTDYILEELMDNSNLMKGVYSESLIHYRSGKDEEAFNLLYRRIPLKSMKMFAMILSKLDSINPDELVLHMEALENRIFEERTTEAMNHNMRKSLFTTVAATFSAFSVMMNFTVVVVFLGAMDMIEGVF